MPYLVGTEFEPIMLPRECSFVRWIKSDIHARLALVTLVPPLPHRFVYGTEAEVQTTVVSQVALEARWANDSIFPQQHPIVPVLIYVINDGTSRDAPVPAHRVHLILEATLCETQDLAQQALPADIAKREAY
jgi:hypothetical protein